MSLGDKAGLEAVKLINEQTLPAAKAILESTIDKLNSLVVNLTNGAVITITITIPERK
jgi:hypothetical protein